MDCGSIDHSYPSLPATSVINHSSCRKISHWSNQIVGNKNATKIGKTPSTYTLSRTSILQANIKSLQPSMPFYFVVSTSKNRKQPSNNNNDEVLANEQRYRYHYCSRYQFHSFIKHRSFHYSHSLQYFLQLLVPHSIRNPSHISFEPNLSQKKEWERSLTSTIFNDWWWFDEITSRVLVNSYELSIDQLSIFVQM